MAINPDRPRQALSTLSLVLKVQKLAGQNIAGNSVEKALWQKAYVNILEVK